MYLFVPTDKRLISCKLLKMGLKNPQALSALIWLTPDYVTRQTTSLFRSSGPDVIMLFIFFLSLRQNCWMLSWNSGKKCVTVTTSLWWGTVLSQPVKTRSHGVKAKTEAKSSFDICRLYMCNMPWRNPSKSTLVMTSLSFLFFCLVWTSPKTMSNESDPTETTVNYFVIEVVPFLPC